MHTSLRAMRYVFAEVLLKALVPCSPVFRYVLPGPVSNEFKMSPRRCTEAI